MSVNRNVISRFSTPDRGELGQELEKSQEKFNRLSHEHHLFKKMIYFADVLNKGVISAFEDFYFKSSIIQRVYGRAQ